MKDPTAQHIVTAMTTVRLISLLLASYCQINEETTGDPVPLDLPVELRARIQFLIDHCHDTDEEAQKCLAIVKENA